MQMWWNVPMASRLPKPSQRDKPFIPDWLSTGVLLAAIGLLVLSLATATFDLGPSWFLEAVVGAFLVVGVLLWIVFAYDARHSGRSWLRSLLIGLREALDFLFWMP